MFGNEQTDRQGQRDSDRDRETGKETDRETEAERQRETAMTDRYRGRDRQRQRERRERDREREEGERQRQKQRQRQDSHPHHPAGPIWQKEKKYKRPPFVQPRASYVCNDTTVSHLISEVARENKPPVCKPLEISKFAMSVADNLEITRVSMGKRNLPQIYSSVISFDSSMGVCGAYH